MKRVLAHPLNAPPDALMARAGYVRHCVEAGRACYHRRLNEPPWPRFHALVAITDAGMEIDLHFDAQDPIERKSNHDKAWAYEGGRVDGEMRRIFNVLCGNAGLKQVYHPTGKPVKKTKIQEKKRRGIIDILFRSM